jgi:hypothetical protein
MRRDVSHSKDCKNKKKESLHERQTNSKFRDLLFISDTQVDHTVEDMPQACCTSPTQAVQRTPVHHQPRRCCLHTPQAHTKSVDNFDRAGTRSGMAAQPKKRIGMQDILRGLQVELEAPPLAAQQLMRMELLVKGSKEPMRTAG